MEFVCRGMSTSFRRLVFRYCLSPMEEGSFSLRKGHKSRYNDDLLQMPSLTAVLVSILDNLYQGEALLKDGTYSIRPSPSSSLTLCQLRRKEKTQREIAKELGISRSYVSRIEKRRLRFTCASVPGTNPICVETKTNVQAFHMRNNSPNFQNGNMETRPVHPVT